MYDPKCEALAEQFLADEEPELQSPAHVRALAQAIQDVVDGEIAAMRGADEQDED